QTATLLPIIREQVKPDSIVYTDCYKSYDVLDVSEFSHFRINHSTHFKECEWRFNNSEIKFQISILKQLVKQDLF
ncbi:transposase, partial [Neisseria musculi]